MFIISQDDPAWARCISAKNPEQRLRLFTGECSGKKIDAETGNPQPAYRLLQVSRTQCDELWECFGPLISSSDNCVTFCMFFHTALTLGGMICVVALIRWIPGHNQQLCDGSPVSLSGKGW